MPDRGRRPPYGSEHVDKSRESAAMNVGAPLAAPSGQGKPSSYKVVGSQSFRLLCVGDLIYEIYYIGRPMQDGGHRPPSRSISSLFPPPAILSLPHNVPNRGIFSLF
jgi:hypothetical protein